MPDEENVNAEENQEAPKKKKGNSNIGMLIGVIIGVLLIQAGIAFAVVKETAPKSDDTEVAQDSTTDSTESSGDLTNASVSNEQFTPNPFTVVVNIAGTDGGRFLKVSLQLAFDADLERNKEFGIKYLNYEIPIQNHINQYLSSLTLEEVQDRNAQLNIRRDLLRGINKLFPPNTGEISNVYITEFIVQ
jgi:flagellar basal body-associated protein FliL